MVLDRVAIYGALLMELWHEHREINAEQDAKDPISLTGQHKAPAKSNQVPTKSTEPSETTEESLQQLRFLSLPRIS